METQQNPSPPPPPSAAVSITNGAVSSEAAAAAAMAGEGALYVQVITDEQMEVLRRQISVYATICEQLVEMHKAVTAHNDSIAGMRLGNIYCDPLMTPGGYKIAARQRWTPTPVQLQTLESIFDHGNGTPSKQKIKEIAHQLMQHGQISETNVYNWFQNRRARSKRKQSSSLPSNTESEAEAEAEIESPSEGKAKSQKMTSIDTEKASSDMQHYTSQEPQRAQGMSPSNSKSSGSTNQMSFYENILLNQRMDHLMGRMELPGDYSPFQSGERYDLSPL